MQIHSASSSLKVHCHNPVPTPSEQGAKERSIVKPGGQTNHGASDSEDTPRTTGVVRLLQAGHFRGVADVRLRTNFDDQIAQRAEPTPGDVAAEKGDSLVDSVNTHVQILLNQLEIDDALHRQVDALVGEFGDTVNALITHYSSEQDAELLRSELVAAFDVLVGELRRLVALGPIEPEAPTTHDITEPSIGEQPIVLPGGEADLMKDSSNAALDPPAHLIADPDPTGQAPTPESADPLVEITTAFTESLQALMSAITRPTRLPELSTPSGRGGAYNKFMELYQQLPGAAEADLELLA